MQVAMPAVEVGRVYAGKYRVERLLGIGGMGIVLAATHLDLDQRVALKLLRDDIAKDASALSRFMREARAAARIRSEHVARVLDVGRHDDGTPFMVMELLEGADLDSIVERQGPLPVATAVDYVLHACDALAEAHALGIVHRDIKPGNLFLTHRPDGSPCVKVLDFGISKSAHSTDGKGLDLTQTNTVMGSPQYMAPEQMRSARDVDARADIWAIGTLMHELLTGRPPWLSTSMPELCAMILQDRAPRLGANRGDIPPELEAAVARCLEKDPAARFPSMGDLARALAPFASAEGQKTFAGTMRASQRLPSLVPHAGGAAPPSRSGADVATVVGAGLPLVQTNGSAPALATIVTTAPARAPAPWPRAAAATGALVLVLATVGVVGWTRRGRTTTAPTATIVTSQPPPSAPLPVPEPSTSVVAPSVVAVPVPSASASVAPTPRGRSPRPRSPEAPRPDVDPKRDPADPWKNTPPATSTTPPSIATSRYD